MENQGAEHQCRAMLVSLGGSPEPVLYTLGQQQPEYILFFVSAESAGQIQGSSESCHISVMISTVSCHRQRRSSETATVPCVIISQVN
jgi:hypothetical protein